MVPCELYVGEPGSGKASGQTGVVFFQECAIKGFFFFSLRVELSTVWAFQRVVLSTGCALYGLYYQRGVLFKGLYYQRGVRSHGKILGIVQKGV